MKNLAQIIIAGVWGGVLGFIIGSWLSAPPIVVAAFATIIYFIVLGAMND